VHYDGDEGGPAQAHGNASDPAPCLAFASGRAYWWSERVAEAGALALRKTGPVLRQAGWRPLQRSSEWRWDPAQVKMHSVSVSHHRMTRFAFACSPSAVIAAADPYKQINVHGIVLDVIKGLWRGHSVRASPVDCCFRAGHRHVRAPRRPSPVDAGARQHAQDGARPAGGSLAVWFADRRGVLDKVNVTTVYGRYQDTVADKAVCFEAAVPLCRGQ